MTATYPMKTLLSFLNDACPPSLWRDLSCACPTVFLAGILIVPARPLAGFLHYLKIDIKAVFTIYLQQTAVP